MPAGSLFYERVDQHRRVTVHATAWRNQKGCTGGWTGPKPAQTFLVCIMEVTNEVWTVKVEDLELDSTIVREQAPA